MRPKPGLTEIEGCRCRGTTRGTVETCPRRGMAIVVRPPRNPLSETESAQGGEAVGETRRCQRWIWRTKVTEKATGRPGSCEPGSEKA